MVKVASNYLAVCWPLCCNFKGRISRSVFWRNFLKEKFKTLTAQRIVRESFDFITNGKSTNAFMFLKYCSSTQPDLLEIEVLENFHMNSTWFKSVSNEITCRKSTKKIKHFLFYIKHPAIKILSVVEVQQMCKSKSVFCKLDLNCCCCSGSLPSKKINWSKAFEHFVTLKQSINILLHWSKSSTFCYLIILIWVARLSGHSNTGEHQPDLNILCLF